MSSTGNHVKFGIDIPVCRLSDGNQAVFDFQVNSFKFATEDVWKWFNWCIVDQDGSRIVLGEYSGSLVA